MLYDHHLDESLRPTAAAGVLPRTILVEEANADVLSLSITQITLNPFLHDIGDLSVHPAWPPRAAAAAWKAALGDV
jgi:hypothetical protein